MFRSNWLFFGTVGGILILGLVLSTSKATAENTVSPAVHCPSVEDSCRNYTKWDHGTKSSYSLPIRIIQDKADEESGRRRAENSYENEKKDLAAQESMAKAANDSVVITRLQTILAAIGTIGLIISLGLSLHAVAITRRIGEATVRAYLSIVPDAPGDSARTITTSNFKILNSGQSPAYNVRHIADIFVHDHPLIEDQGDMIIPTKGQETPSTMLNAGTHFSVPVKRDGISKADWDDVRWGDKAVYFVAHVFYEDVFRKTHVTKFCAYAAFAKLSETDPRTAKFKKGDLVWECSWELTNILNDAT